MSQTTSVQKQRQVEKEIIQIGERNLDYKKIEGHKTHGKMNRYLEDLDL